MSNFLTRLSRFWRTFRHPTGFIGRDLEGNMYFERRNPIPDSKRPKRTVKYCNETDIWDYIGGKRRLPAQWSAWLSHTRLEPPTMQELQQDWTRQERLKVNVAMIAKRDAEERLLLAQQTANDRSPPNQLEPLSVQEPPTSAEPSPPPKNALPKMPSKVEYEPEAWAPRARTRGT